MEERYAPGRPGLPARWTSSAKIGVGTALTKQSRVWFTISHGIFNEIYYPRLDQACVRDLGLIFTDGRDFFSEEKRHAYTQLSFLREGVPAYRLVNTCKVGRYRVEKEIRCKRRRTAGLILRLAPEEPAFPGNGLSEARPSRDTEAQRS